MSPYRHVLCPVDFSDASRTALAWSLAFSKDVGSRLSVLHVVDTTFLAVGNLVAVPDAARDMRRRAEEKLHEWGRELDLSRSGVDVQIVDGAAEPTIVAKANEGGVDLVVMGTHGLSGFQKLLLGSVTEKVLHRARVPMLTLSPSAHDCVPGKPSPRTVLLAIDFGEETQAVVRHGVWLGEHYGARIIAFHAVPVPYVVLNEGTLERLGQKELERLKDSLTRERREDLRALLPGAGELLVKVGSPSELLRAVVAERSVDLVVMGAGGHGESGFRWLGSTCHKLVRSAPCPVLVAR
jgi:nucleotide-binding universal stress UspA family protein